MGIAVHVQPIEHERVGHLRQLRLGAVAGAKRDDVAVAVHVRLEFEEHQLPVVGRRSGGRQRGHVVRRFDLRQKRRIFGRHARAVGGERGVGRGRPDRNVVGECAFVRQHEVADVGGIRREHDHVTGLRRVDGCLQVAALRHRNRFGPRG
jgi:hypothetical protein